MCVCVYYIILYYIVLYYIILYHIIFYYIILYYVMLCYIILYYVMLYYIMLCYIILCYVILYYIIIYIYIYIKYYQVYYSSYLSNLPWIFSAVQWQPEGGIGIVGSRNSTRSMRARNASRGPGLQPPTTSRRSKAREMGLISTSHGLGKINHLRIWWIMMEMIADNGRKWARIGDKRIIGDHGG